MLPQPSYSLAFSNIHLSAFSAPSNIQLYIQLEKLFSYQILHLFKLFQPSYFPAFKPFFSLFNILLSGLFNPFKYLDLCSTLEMFNF